MAAYDSDDESLALRLMEECAEADEPVACFMMALWCAGKEGMPVDQERSARWLARFEELAEDDNLEAQWELGQNHRFGNLVPQNIERANYWLERCANGGYAEAQHYLAWYYETGQYDYPVNRTAADRWYQKAFDLEHPETLYLFAVRQFKDGQPTAAALELLRIAADKGFRWLRRPPCVHTFGLDQVANRMRDSRGVQGAFTFEHVLNSERLREWCGAGQFRVFNHHILCVVHILRLRRRGGKCLKQWPASGRPYMLGF